MILKIFSSVFILSAPFIVFGMSALAQPKPEPQNCRVIHQLETMIAAYKNEWIDGPEAASYQDLTHNLELMNAHFPCEK